MWLSFDKCRKWGHDAQSVPSILRRRTAMEHYLGIAMEDPNRRIGPCVDGSKLARRSFTSQAWSVQPCVRPLSAVHMTAGIMLSADQVPVTNSHSRMQWPKWVVLIAGSTGSALRAVRPPNLHITPWYSARSR